MTSLAIVGATGAVGRTMLDIVVERGLPIDDLRLMASSRSAGTTISTKWGDVVVEDLATADPAGVEIALFSAGGGRSLRPACRARETGVGRSGVGIKH